MSGKGGKVLLSGGLLFNGDHISPLFGTKHDCGLVDTINQDANVGELEQRNVGYKICKRRK